MMNDHVIEWSTKNVLVTGVNGFVGGNIAKDLVMRGANVVGLVRNLDQRSLLYFENIDKAITIVVGDLCDRALLERIMVEQMIDVVFHLAAQVEVGVGVTSPYTTWETNVRGTYTLMESIRQYAPAVKAVVVASTDKAYGSYPIDMMPYQEDYPLRPQYPYDTSKACSDLIAQSYATELFELPVVITRFCNIYGPGQLNFSALIPDAISGALKCSEFRPRSNGEYLRDFLFISDVIELYIKIAEKIISDPDRLRGEIFNAGTCEPRTVRSIIEEIYRQCDNGSDLELVLAQMESCETTGEIKTQYMDYRKAERFFGWSPTTNFHDGIANTIQWFRHYLSIQHQR